MDMHGVCFIRSNHAILLHDPLAGGGGNNFERLAINS